MPEKVTVEAQAPPSSDEEILQQIRGLINQPQQPLPPPTQVRDPLMMAIAGGFDPEFRRANVDPILEAQRNRPMLERKYADDQRGQQIQDLTGVLEQQRSQGYANRAQGEYDARRQQEDAAVQAQMFKLDAIGSELQQKAASAQDMIDLYGQSQAPADIGRSLRIKGALQEAAAYYSEIQKNPTMAPEQMGEMLDHLSERISDVDEALDEFNSNSDAQSAASLLHQRRLQEIEAGNQGRMDVAGLKAGAAGGVKMSPKDRAEKRDIQSFLSELDVLEPMVTGDVGGPVSGHMPDFSTLGGAFGGKERASMRATAANLKSILLLARSGGAVSDAEFDRLEPLLPDVNKDKLKNQTDIETLRRYMQKKLELIDSSYGIEGGATGMAPGLEEGDVEIGEIPYTEQTTAKTPRKR